MIAVGPRSSIEGRFLVKNNTVHTRSNNGFYTQYYYSIVYIIYVLNLSQLYIVVKFVEYFITVQLMSKVQ